MPNYVLNVLKMIGEKNLIDTVLKHIEFEGYGIGSINFDKIIPIPLDLDVEPSAKVYDGLEAYEKFIEKAIEEGKKEEELTEQDENEYLSQIDLGLESWGFGKKAYNNRKKYGMPTRHEWRIANWNTKWPASQYNIAQYEDCTIILFITACNHPQPVIAKLAEMYPGITFMHKFADDHLEGGNCGVDEYVQGKRIAEHRWDGQEGVEFSKSLWDFKEACERDKD